MNKSRSCQWFPPRWNKSFPVAVTLHPGTLKIWTDVSSHLAIIRVQLLRASTLYSLATQQTRGEHPVSPRFEGLGKRLSKKLVRKLVPGWQPRIPLLFLHILRSHHSVYLTQNYEMTRLGPFSLICCSVEFVDNSDGEERRSSVLPRVDFSLILF